jgi:hypothetical protein
MNWSASTNLSRLVATSFLYIVISLVGTGIAILEDRPAQFGGSSTGLPVVQDFLYGQGTAMSPPLYWLVAQIALTLLAPRRDRWGTVGVAGLAAFGLLSGIGALGEPILLEIFNPATFDLLKAVVQTGMIVVPFVMMVLGVLEWSRRRRGLAFHPEGRPTE